MDRLDQKTAVITGAGAGIGYSIATLFAARGAKIVLAGRNARRGSSAEQALRATGAEALYVPTDVSVEEDVKRLMDVARITYGSLDILINNAGPSGSELGIGAIHELPSSAFDKAMKVGAYGPFWCCKHALPHMIASHGGAIVNISATAAVRALPHFGGYAIAKSVLEALGRQVANDYAPDGIRCNTLLVGTVRPGVGDVSTLPEGFDAAALDRTIAKTTMLGTIGSYEHVAQAALFLVSNASAYITGASLPVEGGALGKLQYPDYRSAMEKTQKN